MINFLERGLTENMKGFMQALYVYVEQNSLETMARQKMIEDAQAKNRELMKKLSTVPEQTEEAKQRQEIDTKSAMMEQIRLAKERIGTVTKRMHKLETKIEILGEWVDER